MVHNMKHFLKDRVHAWVEAVRFPKNWKKLTKRQRAKVKRCLRNSFVMSTVWLAFIVLFYGVCVLRFSLVLISGFYIWCFLYANFTDPELDEE